MNTGNGDEISAEGGAGSQQLARPGPRTPQGKRRSRQNARRHGILAGVLLRDGCLGDSRDDFSKLLAGLRTHFEPTGFIENLLVEKLALLYLRLARVYKADLTAAPLIFAKVQACLRGDESPVVTEPIDRESEIAIVRRMPTPEVLMRYEINLDCHIERTLNQLERLQRMRLGQPVPPPVSVELSA